MTKAELIKALSDLDDDATIYVAMNSIDSNGMRYATHVWFDDKVTGAKLQNEITIVGEY